MGPTSEGYAQQPFSSCFTIRVLLLLALHGEYSLMLSRKQGHLFTSKL